MNSFYDKTNYNSEDILELIKNEVEESIYLDFKEAGALSKSDGNRKEIGKDISSFANSDGGIIIYGIKELNHKAHELSFIDGDEFTKEWIEQVINSSIQRHIPDLLIYPIRFDNSIKKTVYLIKIPKSVEAPHISKDKRFYKRFNFESVAMEEYEIRQLYGRRSKSKLVIGGYSFLKAEKDNSEYFNLIFEASIINEGDIPESSYKLNVYFNNFNSHINLKWEPLLSNCDYTRYENHRVKISAPGKVTIYPTEKVTGIRFTIEIEKDFAYEALNDLTFELLLFYANGEDRLEGTLKGIMDKILNDIEQDHEIRAEE